MATRDQVEILIAETAPKVTAAGGGTGLLGFLTSSHFVGLVGLIVAVAGFLTSWYFKRKHYRLQERMLNEQNRREEIEHLRRLEKMETKPGALQ